MSKYHQRKPHAHVVPCRTALLIAVRRQHDMPYWRVALSKREEIFTCEDRYEESTNYNARMRRLTRARQVCIQIKCSRNEPKIHRLASPHLPCILIQWRLQSSNQHTPKPNAMHESSPCMLDCEISVIHLTSVYVRMASVVFEDSEEYNYDYTLDERAQRIVPHG